MSILETIFSIKSLRNKIFFTLLMLVVYRLGSHIPISGLDLEKMSSLFSSGLLGFFNLFSGGGLSRYSVFALGILPYINASIIMQLVTIIYPKFKELSQEGEYGRKKIAQYTRFLAVALSFFQATILSLSLQQFIFPSISPIIFIIYSIIGLVAGATIVMWLGEIITESGIGNGASILIFMGIIAEMPRYIKNTYTAIQSGTSSINVLALVLVMILIIASIVCVQEAQRKVPIQYAKKITGRNVSRGNNTYLPLRLIQGGVMPIIFASAILQFPLMFLQMIKIPQLNNFFDSYYTYDGLLYNSFFCLLIFFFAYFYTAITFNPKEIADNIKKYGGFIMGVRPGASTIEFLDKIISKLTLVGASFLAIVAMAPIIAANVTNVKSFMGLGGTALLIIVGVAIDLLKQVESHLISNKYEALIN